MLESPKRFPHAALEFWMSRWLKAMPTREGEAQRAILAQISPMGRDLAAQHDDAGYHWLLTYLLRDALTPWTLTAFPELAPRVGLLLDAVKARDITDIYVLPRRADHLYAGVVERLRAQGYSPLPMRDQDAAYATGALALSHAGLEAACAATMTAPADIAAEYRDGARMLINVFVEVAAVIALQQPGILPHLIGLSRLTGLRVAREWLASQPIVRDAAPVA